MKFILFVNLLIFFVFSEGICQQIELKGTAPQFANEFLPIQIISNPITGTTEITDSIFFDDNGSFISNIETQKQGWLFINTGIFRISLFTRPGIGYEIELPPKTTKSEANIRNPFFKPVNAHIQVIKEYSINKQDKHLVFNDINSKIFRFDTLLASKNIEMMTAIKNQKPYNSDSLISNIESMFAKDSSGYFQKYRNYRYGIIKLNSRDVGLQYIYENFLKSVEPETGNKAWMELFSEMYKEFLFFFSRTDEGKNINYLVNATQDVNAILTTLMKHPAIQNENMAELILLQEIFDIYYKDYFSRQALVMILDTIMDHPVVQEHAIYAAGIKKYLTRLKIGQKPPGFKLVDMNDTFRNLDDFRGKYTYLNFCTPDNYSCLKEFPFLKAINNVHSNYLNIVTVMITEKSEEMKEFMKKNNYEWTALFYGNDNQLLQNYDVKAFPTCYLLDPDGIIIQSPATLATEGFEQQLFRIMRSRGDL